MKSVKWLQFHVMETSKVTKISIDTLNTNEIGLQPSSLLDRIPKRLVFTKSSLSSGQTHLLENTAARSPAITSNWVPSSSQNCIANPYTDTYVKVSSLWAAEYIGITTFLLTNYIQSVHLFTLRGGSETSPLPSHWVFLALNSVIQLGVHQS